MVCHYILLYYSVIKLGVMKIKHDTKIKCNGCGNIVPVRKLKKINGGLLCPDCVRKKRKKHREFLLRDVIGVRKRSNLEKEWKKERDKLNKFYQPKIRDKVMKGMNLSRDEKNFLYRNCRKNGLTIDESRERMNNLTIKLKKLVKKLRKKKVTEEEINRRFKEEFARLCEV